MRTVIALLLAASVAPASAAECTFATAIYKQPESAAVLRFQPTQRLARFPGTTNAFYLDIPGEKVPLLAWVIWNNGESRPNASLMKDCPPDGETNEDFEACTPWEGVMYALGEGGAALLPGEDEPPPAKILLPDFGRKLNYADQLTVEDAPWDVFAFSGCGEDQTR